MHRWLLGSVQAAALIGTLCLGLVGCTGNGLDGTYRHTGGGPIALDFKGSKVTVNAMGDTKTLDYKLDGDKLTIINPTEGNLEFTRNSDGSLTGIWGVFAKSK